MSGDKKKSVRAIAFVVALCAAMLAGARSADAATRVFSLNFNTSDLAVGQNLFIRVGLNGNVVDIQKKGLVLEVLKEQLNDTSPGQRVRFTCGFSRCDFEFPGLGSEGVVAFRARIRRLSDNAILYHTARDRFVQWRTSNPTPPPPPPPSPTGLSAPTGLSLTVNGTSLQTTWDEKGKSAGLPGNPIYFTHGSNLTIVAKANAPLPPGWYFTVWHEGDTSPPQANFVNDPGYFVTCFLTAGQSDCPPVTRASARAIGQGDWVTARMTTDKGYSLLITIIHTAS